MCIDQRIHNVGNREYNNILEVTIKKRESTNLNPLRTSCKAIFHGYVEQDGRNGFVVNNNDIINLVKAHDSF